MSKHGPESQVWSLLQYFEYKIEGEQAHLAMIASRLSALARASHETGGSAFLWEALTYRDILTKVIELARDLRTRFDVTTPTGILAVELVRSPGAMRHSEFMNSIRADGLRVSTFEELDIIGEAMSLLWPWERIQKNDSPYWRIMTTSESELKTVTWAKFPDGGQIEEHRSFIQHILSDKVCNRNDEVFACVRTKGA